MSLRFIVDYHYKYSGIVKWKPTRRSDGISRWYRSVLRTATRPTTGSASSRQQRPDLTVPLTRSWRTQSHASRRSWEARVEWEGRRLSITSKCIPFIKPLNVLARVIFTIVLWDLHKKMIRVSRSFICMYYIHVNVVHTLHTRHQQNLIARKTCSTARGNPQQMPHPLNPHLHKNHHQKFWRRRQKPRQWQELLRLYLKLQQRQAESKSGPLWTRLTNNNSYYPQRQKHPHQRRKYHMSGSPNTKIIGTRQKRKICILNTLANGTQSGQLNGFLQ